MYKQKGFISDRKVLIAFISLAFMLLISGCREQPSPEKKTIEGLTILSENKEKALEIINYAKKYNINHLQLSHNIVHKFKHLKRPKTEKLVNELIDTAHKSGIDEVVLWNHALYWLGYYPDKFKTGPDSTLNLDNP